MYIINKTHVTQMNLLCVDKNVNCTACVRILKVHSGVQRCECISTIIIFNVLFVIEILFHQQMHPFIKHIKC